MRSTAAHGIILPLLATLAACGQDAETGSAEDAGSESRMASTASMEFTDDFEDRACEHLTEDEVREIFEVAPDTEMTVSGFSPCVYQWEMPIPGQPETTAEFMAGVSYVVAVEDDAEEARRFFTSLAEGASAEQMEGLAREAAEAATEDSDLSEEQREEVERSAEDMFGQELTYATLQGVGDEASWEQTHGSLLVLAGNAIFRTIAQSNYFDPAERGLASENYPELAAQVARAVID